MTLPTPRTHALALVLLASPGCREDAPPAADCNEEITVLGPTDPTPLGFTAQELLGQVLGERVDTLYWTTDGSYYAMPDTSVELSIALSYSGGELRWVESTPSDSCEAAELGECDVGCPSRLEFDGSLAFSTADGVFDELWTTVVTATTASEAVFSVEFHPDDTQGSLSAASFVIPDDRTLQTLTVGGIVGPTSTTGGLGLQLALPDETGWEFNQVGEWPPGG